MLSILLNLLFGFLSEERLLRVSNENWEHYHFDLDDAGFVIGERGFDRGYRSYQRDRAGRVIRETLPSGKFKEYEYDKCGRVTRITHDYDKVEEQTYSYYSSRRLQEAKNEHALVSFRYDNMGLPVEERCNEHKILRTYDQLGQIATLTSSLGANLTYERNEFGELLNFKARQEETENHFVSEHRYDSLGFELERMLPGGISQSLAYDNIGRPSTARYVSRPRYAENASTIGARQTDRSRRRTAYMVLPPMSTVPRGICKRRPMLMAEKNTDSRTRWATSSMTPNAS